MYRSVNKMIHRTWFSGTRISRVLYRPVCECVPVSTNYMGDAMRHGISPMTTSGAQAMAQCTQPMLCDFSLSTNPPSHNSATDMRLTCDFCEKVQKGGLSGDGRGAAVDPSALGPEPSEYHDASSDFGRGTSSRAQGDTHGV